MSMNRQMMKGNEAIAEAAVQAGCRYYFGYPITPQSEIPEYMSKRLPEVGGTFIQAESEIAAINMVYGAAGAGARAMTSSSSPGVSLKQEGISYIAGAELPCLIVNIVRGGPGLGSIQPAQSDYYQATRGGGHGPVGRCQLYRLRKRKRQHAPPGSPERGRFADYDHYDKRRESGNGLQTGGRCSAAVSVQDSGNLLLKDSVRRTDRAVPEGDLHVRL